MVMVGLCEVCVSQRTRTALVGLVGWVGLGVFSSLE